MITKVNHFAIGVKDVDQVAAFFRDALEIPDIQVNETSGPIIDAVLGMSGVKIKRAQVEIAGTMLEFVQYLSPRGKDVRGDINDIGSPHVSFDVDDLEAMYKRLTQRGTKFKSSPQWRTVEGRLKGEAHLWGPEGMNIQLVQSK